MIKTAMVFIIFALILYSTAIFRERMLKQIKPWILTIFSLGFICDLSGTSMMFLSATNKFNFSLHIVAGYLALTIMSIHLIWAITATIKKGKSQERFTKYSIYAWAVWLIAFLSGIPMAN